MAVKTARAAGGLKLPFVVPAIFKQDDADIILIPRHVKYVDDISEDGSGGGDEDEAEDEAPDEGITEADDMEVEGDEDEEEEECDDEDMEEQEKVFYVHRARLAAASTTFRDMFDMAQEHPEDLNRHGRVTLRLQESAETLNTLLHFIYADDPSDFPTLYDFGVWEVLNLWDAARKYGQNTATVRAEDYL